MSNRAMVPTGDYEDRKVRDIRAGDRVFIDGEWREIEAGGSWPESPNTVELTTEPHSEGFTFNPSVSLPVAVGDVDSRPEGERFTLSMELGNAEMATAQDVADALARVSAEVGETGSWGGNISDINGNTVGAYLLTDEAKPKQAALIVNEQVVELTTGMYRALCGLVHPSDAIDPASVLADQSDWDALRAMFPLADALTDPSEVPDAVEQPDTATLTLSVEMGEHVQSPAEVAGVVGWFVEDRREQLEAGGFVSGPIRNEDGDRVGSYRIAFPIS